MEGLGGLVTVIPQLVTKEVLYSDVHRINTVLPFLKLFSLSLLSLYNSISVMCVCFFTLSPLFSFLHFKFSLCQEFVLGILIP